MPHYHAETLGQIAVDIPEDDECRYDWCSCGNRKRKSAEVCNPCRAHIRAAEQARQIDEENARIRAEAHEFYRQQVERGWTIQDIIAHAAREREKRGDPIRPRFWSSQSLLSNEPKI